MAAQYLKAGLKNFGVVFLMTDAQVAQEQFLVVINDCLASGEVADLFADDEVDNIVAAVRNEVNIFFKMIYSNVIGFVGEKCGYCGYKRKLLEVYD